MTRDLADLTARTLDLARKAGAEAADVLVVEGTSISIDVRNGRLEQAERAEQIDLGLRVFIGKQLAVVSSSDVRDEALTRMAERAVAMAKEAPSDPFAGLAEPEELARDTDVSRLELVDPTPEPDPATLEAEARRAEAAAREVQGVTQIDSASAGYGRRQVHLAASNGFSAGFARSDRALSCVAISGTGTAMERDYDYDSRVFAADLRSAEDIGRTAGMRAVERQGARRPPTGSFPVLFDERIAGSLIGHLLQAINGSAIVRGASWLRDGLDRQVMPDGISLTEQPHRARTPGSRLFDAEGLPTRERAIVEDGVLRGWTLDLATGRKLGLPSTGNASRAPGGMPSPSAGNVTLTQGADSPEALIAGMKRGLVVTSLIGSTINSNTGDYSRGASGFWVEEGEIRWPVNECTIAGNLRDMLLRIVPANDARAWTGRVVPSILIDGMVIAGD